jgi:hypothetical protein
MKYIKEYRSFHKSTIKAFHSSNNEIKEFDPSGTWFTPREDWAKSYHETSSHYGQGYLYEVEIKGIILKEEEAIKLATQRGLNWDTIIDILCSNPSQKERLEIIESFDGIDGFYHWDYDPTDFQKDGISIFVFNPKRDVRIIRQLMP